MQLKKKTKMKKNSQSLFSFKTMQFGTVPEQFGTVPKNRKGPVCYVLGSKI